MKQFGLVLMWIGGAGLVGAPFNRLGGLSWAIIAAEAGSFLLVAGLGATLLRHSRAKRQGLAAVPSVSEPVNVSAAHAALQRLCETLEFMNTNSEDFRIEEFPRTIASRLQGDIDEFRRHTASVRNGRRTSERLPCISRFDDADRSLQNTKRPECRNDAQVIWEFVSLAEEQMKDALHSFQSSQHVLASLERPIVALP